MPAPEFKVNTYRYDPYQNWRFRVKWIPTTPPGGGSPVYVAGISKVSGLSRTTDVVKHRVGGDPGVARAMPGQSTYEAITLERGITHDKAFDQWANKVWDYTNSTASPAVEVASLKDFRKDMIIELYNEAGQKVLAYHVYRCWVSEFHGLPELDGMGNAVAIQMLKLENEGWERDWTIGEPTQPSFTLPAA